MEIRTSDPRNAAVRKSESDLDTFYETAAKLLTQAFNHPRHGITRDEVAHLLGVSRNLVDRWCNPAEHSCPSQVQLLRLPVSFQLAYRSALDQHFGHRGEAFKRLADFAGYFALELEA